MTEIEELRWWSAEVVMGWVVKVRDVPRPGHKWFYDKDGNEVVAYYRWRPDDPNTGQIWQIINRMEDDYDARIESYREKDMNFYEMGKFSVTVESIDNKLAWAMAWVNTAEKIPWAFLRAAKAAWRRND